MISPAPVISSKEPPLLLIVPLPVRHVR